MTYTASLSQGVRKRFSGKAKCSERRDVRTADLRSPDYSGGYWFNICHYTGLVEIRFLNLSDSKIIGSVKNGRWVPETQTAMTADQLRNCIRWIQSERVHQYVCDLYCSRKTPYTGTFSGSPNPVPVIPRSTKLNSNPGHKAYKQRSSKRA